MLARALMFSSWRVHPWIYLERYTNLGLRKGIHRMDEITQEPLNGVIYRNESADVLWSISRRKNTMFSLGYTQAEEKTFSKVGRCSESRRKRRGWPRPCCGDCVRRYLGRNCKMTEKRTANTKVAETVGGETSTR